MYELPRTRVLPVHVDAAVLAVRRLQRAERGGWVRVQDARAVYLTVPLGEVAHVGPRQFGNAVRAAVVGGRLESQNRSEGKGGYHTYIRIPGGSKA